MKKAILAVLTAIVLNATAFADVHVDPYFRSNGTFVQGHYRSDPDGSRYNNWSYNGNVNPYTGKQGYSR